MRSSRAKQSRRSNALDCFVALLLTRSLASPLQLGVGADEDFDQARFGLAVIIQSIAECGSQVIKRRLHERGQSAAILAVAARGAPPAAHALAERRKPVEYNVDQVAIALQIRAAFVGDRVELL